MSYVVSTFIKSFATEQECEKYISRLNKLSFSDNFYIAKYEEGYAVWLRVGTADNLPTIPIKENNE